MSYFLIFVFLILFPNLADAASPFGVTAPQAPVPVGGGFLREYLSWIYQLQADFYKELTGLVRQAKEEGSSAFVLIGFSFLYGIFHAAGPGHGKVVISTYMLANEESAKRGMIISFLAAFLQGGVAVLLVGSAVFIFNLTSFALTEATHWFERASFALIALLGLYLLWSKFPRITSLKKKVSISNHDHHGHGHSCGCGGHAAKPDDLRQPLTLRSAWAAILSVGLRPCSGALIVLVFAASQEIFTIGVLSAFAMALGTAITITSLAALAVGAKELAVRYASFGAGSFLFKGIELLGALIIFLLGITLFAASFQG